MIKSKTKSLLALALALSVFSTALIGISAKSQNSTEKKVATGNTQSVENHKNQVESSIPLVKNTKVSTPKVKKTTKDIKKAAKVQTKTVKNKQLSSLESKLNVIESDTNKLGLQINAFIATTKTGSVIKTNKNKTAFINSTTGKLKALSNRLTAVENNSKALSEKVDKTSDQYKNLVNKITTIKTKIANEGELLKTLKANK